MARFRGGEHPNLKGVVHDLVLTPADADAAEVARLHHRRQQIMCALSLFSLSRRARALVAHAMRLCA